METLESFEKLNIINYIDVFDYFNYVSCGGIFNTFLQKFFININNVDRHKNIDEKHFISEKNSKILCVL